MVSTSPLSAAGPNPTRSPAVQYEGELSRSAYLGISEEQSADIEINTADGDTVTISSDIHSEANLLTYRHLAFNGEGGEAEQLQLAELREERTFALSVTGDLNEQEIADIQALLKDLEKSLKSFLLGNEPAADAQSPGSYASLGSYTADFELHRELTYLDAAQVQVASSAPAVAAATEIDSAGATLPVEAPVQQLAERVQEYRPRPKMLKHLKKLLKALLREMHSSGQIDRRQAGQGAGILDRLFRTIDPQGRNTLEATAAEVRVKQEWASLRYTTSASVPAPPQVEQTA
jgi:hypothetical protein